MSNIVNNIKDKLTGHKGSSETHTNSESQTSQSGNQEYSIQPHPAKSNDPADLQPSGPGNGLRHGGPMEAFHARDPYVPSEQIRNGLPEPETPEQLQIRSNVLNQK